MACTCMYMYTLNSSCFLGEFLGRNDMGGSVTPPAAARLRASACVGVCVCVCLGVWGGGGGESKRANERLAIIYMYIMGSTERDGMGDGGWGEQESE